MRRQSQTRSTPAHSAKIRKSEREIPSYLDISCSERKYLRIHLEENNKQSRKKNYCCLINSKTQNILSVAAGTAPQAGGRVK